MKTALYIARWTLGIAALLAAFGFILWMMRASGGAYGGTP